MATNGLQLNFSFKKSIWTGPSEYKDLSAYDEIAIDLETRDPNLLTMGSGSVRRDGEVVGIAVAVEGWSGYFPIAHEGGGNMDRGLVLDWFEELLSNTSTKIFLKSYCLFN